MAAKKRKLKLSAAERARRRRTALKNFGKRRKTSSSKTKRRVTKVAKRKRTVRRSTVMKPMQVLVASGLYGAVREKLSNFVAPLTQSIPLGSIGDEVGLFFIANYAKKQRMLKNVAQAAMYIEGARIGEAIADGSAFGTPRGVGSGSGFGNPTIL